MTIKQAIEKLEYIQRAHGGEIEVFFDCPHCQHSFAPDIVDRVQPVLRVSAPPKGAGR